MDEGWREMYPRRAASRFPSELSVRGTMRLANRKEELARDDCSSLAKFPVVFFGQIEPNFAVGRQVD